MVARDECETADNARRLVLDYLFFDDFRRIFRDYRVVYRIIPQGLNMKKFLGLTEAGWFWIAYCAWLWAAYEAAVCWVIGS